MQILLNIFAVCTSLSLTLRAFYLERAEGASKGRSIYNSFSRDRLRYLIPTSEDKDMDKRQRALVRKGNLFLKLFYIFFAMTMVSVLVCISMM